MYDHINDDTLAAAATEITDRGGDPAIVLPLTSLLTDAAIMSATGKLEGDHVKAAIHFGVVAGLMQALEALGQPVPCDRPSDAVRAAEVYLTDPAEFGAMLSDALARIGEGDPDAEVAE